MLKDMTVGERIKAYAEEHGIMQKYLAEKAGISTSQMSLVLNGKNNLNVIQYYNVCKALGVPMEFFVEV